MEFLTTTFSPAMTAPGHVGFFAEYPIEGIRQKVRDGEVISAVGHEITAKVLSALLGAKVEFSRVNLSLKDGDTLYCVIPAFRAAESREFTREEVEKAGFRSFVIEIQEA
jgi:hypothetical protein